MSANVRHKWARPDRRPLLVALSVAPVALFSLSALLYAAALAWEGLL